MVRVSKHASRRLKERCGLNKKSVQRMADIAFTNGMKQEDATGQLNRWMASLYCANMDANNIRIYGNYISHGVTRSTSIEKSCQRAKKEISKKSGGIRWYIHVKIAQKKIIVKRINAKN